MQSIMFRELLSLLKSVKSIIIILILLTISVSVAGAVNRFKVFLSELGISDTPHAIGLLLTVLLISPFFIFTLSHNIVNEELKTRTIRFLATKTSRNSIIFGKFYGGLIFWIITLSVATGLISFFSKEFHYLELLQSILFVSYFLSLSILLSVIFKSTIFTNFLGIALSLIMTVIGLWSIASDNIMLKIYSLLTPYYYFFKEEQYYPFITIIFPIIFISIALILFRRRDL